MDAVMSAVLGVGAQATGCVGADSYKAYAEALGYTHIEVLNWSSSAGDWQFLVSKDGLVWHILWQKNNYPRPGFSRGICTEPEFYGTIEDVYKQVEEYYG